MSKIEFPLRQGMEQGGVAELHAVLGALELSVDRREVDARSFGPSTAEAVRAAQTQGGLPPSGEIDEATAALLERRRADRGAMASGSTSPEIERYSVQGTVRDAVGRGLGGRSVAVVALKLRREEELASGKTTRQGFYRLEYSPPLVAKRPVKRFQIVVRVHDADGKLLFAAEPQIAQPRMWMNFMEGGGEFPGESEFEARVEKLGAAMHGASFASLEESDEHGDISYVARGSGVDPEEVMQLALAHRLERATELPAAVCWAFLRQGLPPGLPDSLLAASDRWRRIAELVGELAAGLYALPPAVQRQALEDAVARNLVPLRHRLEVDAILGKLAALAAQEILDRPYAGTPTTLRVLLDLTNLPHKKYARFAALITAHGGTVDDAFWARCQGELAEDEIQDGRRTFELGAFVRHHGPMIAALKARFAQGRFSHLRDVARFSPDEWKRLVDEVGAPGEGELGATPAARNAAFTAEILERVERAHPTAALAARVERGNPRWVAAKPQLRRFFANAADLDLRVVHLDRWLVQHGAVALDGIDSDTRPLVIREVKKLQRVLRLAPTPAAAAALLATGFTSAGRATRAGRARVLKELHAAGIPRADAETVWRTAAHTAGLVLAHAAVLDVELDAPTPAALRDGAPPPDLARLPSLRALVGEARPAGRPSAVGPAAYYADLLGWLRERSTGGGSAKDVLFRRRPDLGTLVLDDAAATQPVAALDLTCEVLERAVADEGKAYDTLRDARFPFTLPFHLPLEELRAGLAALGVPRERLVAALRGRGRGEADVAAEALGLTPLDRKLITTRDVDAQSRLWNVGHTDELRAVPRFVERAGISRAELNQLLGARTVQQGLADTTIGRDDTGAELLTPLTPPRLDRMHRFLRLWRRSGLSIPELDRLLAAPRIADSALDDSALIGVVRARELMRRLELSAEELCALYADLPAELYARAFLAGDAPAAFAPDAVAADDVTVKLEAHLAPLASALALPEAQARLLAARTDGLTTLANLTTLWRHARLARALRLGIDDFLLHLAIFDGDPCADPAATLAFADAVAATRDPAALWAVIGPGTGVDVAALLARLGDERRRAHGEQVRKGEPKLDAIARLLARLPAFADADRRQRVLDLVAGRVEPQAEARNARIAESFAAIGDVAEAQLRLGPLIGASAEDRELEIDLRADFVLHELLRSRAASQLGATVAAALGVGARVAAALLDGLRVGDRGVLAILLDDVVLDHAPADLPAQREALTLLARAAGAAGLLGVDATTLGWLLAHAGEHGALDLATLAQRPSLDSWSALQRLAALAPRFAPFFDAARAGASVAGLHERLAMLTGAQPGDVAAVHAALGLDRDAYQRGDAVQRVVTILELAARAGVPAARLVAWGAADAGADAAAELRAALRGRAEPDQAALRARRRDALVAYLVARPPAADAAWRDRAGLAAHLLVELDAAPGDSTTRLAAATAAVQRFVTRCLAGLEHDAPIDADGDDGWRAWAHLRSPRQWEQGRRVFLRPERALLAEPRPDRSAAFAAFEEAIAGGALGDAAAAAALRGYVASLEETEKLDLRGSAADGDVLHVLARSPLTGRHLVRRRARGAWSAWEAIPVELPENGVVPVVFGGRLMLFWLVFSEQLDEKQDPPPPPTAGQPPPEPRRHWRIRLAWTSQRAGRFTPPQVGARVLVHPWPRPTRTYTLRPRVAGDRLCLDVYVGSSPEFNDRRRWDAASNGPVWLATARHDERAAPWHSSTFVWDGDVREVRLRDGDGGPGRPRAVDWVRTEYGADGRATVALADPQPRLPLPFGARWEHGRVVGGPASDLPLAFPAAARFARALDGGGPAALYRESQEGLDFVPGGATAVACWELFFHAPLAIAERFAALARHEEAARWLGYIFDPTAPAPWICRPLAEAVRARGALLDRLLDVEPGRETVLEARVREWIDRPTEAHRVAALRPASLARLVVKRTTGNLVAWAAALARDGTPAARGEAAGLLGLAGVILGPRPPEPAADVVRAAVSFDELEAILDGDAVASVENALPPSGGGGPIAADAPPLPWFDAQSFAPPPDEELLALWARLEERPAEPPARIAAEVLAAAPPPRPAAAPAPPAEEATAAAEELLAPLPPHRFLTALRRARELVTLAALNDAAFDLALDAARRAERAYRHETGELDARFITARAAPGLALELARLEAAYHDRDARLLEIVRRMALSRIDPAALLSLQTSGACRFELTERHYDHDYPGHYLRRIRSVALTLHAPSNGARATLTLDKNSVRVSPIVGGAYRRRAGADERFVDGLAAVQGIVTSSAEDDPGVFDTSGDRWLPFEGAGAISRWRLTVPRESNDFDPRLVRDVTLTVRYTARDGGELLAAAAAAAGDDVVFIAGARQVELPAAHRGRAVEAAEVWAAANGEGQLIVSIAGAAVPLSRAADGLYHARVPVGGDGPWPLTWPGATPRDHVVALRFSEVGSATQQSHAPVADTSRNEARSQRT